MPPPFQKISPPASEAGGLHGPAGPVKGWVVVFHFQNTSNFYYSIIQEENQKYAPYISVVRLRLRREPHSRPTIVKVFAATPLSTFTSGWGGLSTKGKKIKIFFTYIYPG